MITAAPSSPDAPVRLEVRRDCAEGCLAEAWSTGGAGLPVVWHNTGADTDVLLAVTLPSEPF